MMDLSPTAALWLLPVALPISLFCAWNDMRDMKIPNIAVGAMVLGFAIAGMFAFGFPQFLWQFSHLPVVLLFGFLLNVAGVLGAGDAKFAAAAAPFIALGDIAMLMWLMAGCIAAGFITHRIAKHSPLRRLVPDWKSWDAGRNFPMGLPLGMTLAFYLLIAAFQT